jgi:photosystem II stability/assembly factor-like uncharacterized protein
MRGPFFEDFETHDMVGEEGEARPTLYAAVNTWMWGPLIYRSNDLGHSWKKAKAHPRFPEGNPHNLSLKRIWNLQLDNDGTLYAGVEPAALFTSEDGSNSWEGFDSLNFHATRNNWQPGNGGLCLHTIIIHPKQRRKIRVAISAVGVMGSDDGGLNWRFMNKNIRADFLPTKYPEYGQCVHKIDLNPSKPDVLYLQNHGGVYVSKDFGEKWLDIGKSLPSDYGFPIGVNRHKPDHVYVVPLETMARYPPNGAFQVWVSNDGGKRWRKSAKGLPERSYFNVLREGMAIDGEDPCGIYLGTTNGELFLSADEGNSWQRIAEHLPRIYSVSCIAT